MQLAVGTETYGLYYSLFNITLIFQFLNDFGIQNFTNRHVSQNRDHIKHQYKDLAGLKIALSFLYIIALFAFIWIMDYSSEMYPLIFHLACNQILISGIFFVRSNISGLGFYKTDSFFSVLDRIMLIILGSFLLWHPYFQSWISIDSFVWIQTISLSLTLLAALLFIKRKQLAFSFLSVDFNEIKIILRACLPFAMIYLFSSLYNKMDVVFIGKLLDDGNKQAGIYAASMRLYEACSMISLAFGGLLLAMFSALHNDRNKLQELFKMAMNALVVITIIIVTICTFYAKEIINILYHQTDSYWTDIFRLTMIAFIPGSLNYIFGALFPALHKEKNLVQFYVIASLISFAINYWMILQWKVIGAAYTAIATQSVLLLIQFFYIQKQKLLVLNTVFLRRIMLFIFISFLLCYGIHYLSFNWIIGIILSGTGMLILAITMKMISIKDLLSEKMKD